jgi:hypothetical protein
MELDALYCYNLDDASKEEILIPMINVMEVSEKGNSKSS